MINFDKAIHYDSPFPYTIVEECFDNTTIQKLIDEFPNVNEETSVMGGRKQMSLIKNHTNPTNSNHSEEYTKWSSSSPTWNSFYNWLNTDTVFHSIINQYEKNLNQWDCIINNSSSLKNECFTHIDWSSASDGYTREIHRDSDKRIWSFLIFLSDKDWDGGDFIIHSSDDLKEYPRHIWDNSLPIHKKIEAKKNLGLFFLSTPNSYHSVDIQSNTRSDRKFIYGSYSVLNNKDAFTKRIK